MPPAPGAHILPEPRFPYGGPTSAERVIGDLEPCLSDSPGSDKVFLLISEPKSACLKVPPASPNELHQGHSGRAGTVSPRLEQLGRPHAPHAGSTSSFSISEFTFLF